MISLIKINYNPVGILLRILISCVADRNIFFNRYNICMILGQNACLKSKSCAEHKNLPTMFKHFFVYGNYFVEC